MSLDTSRALEYLKPLFAWLYLFILHDLYKDIYEHLVAGICRFDLHVVVMSL